jgi:hypothetical protein
MKANYRQTVRNELQKIGNDIDCPEQAPSYCWFDNIIVKNSSVTFRKIKTEVRKEMNQTELVTLAAGLTEQFGCKIDAKYKTAGYSKFLYIYFRK